VQLCRENWGESSGNCAAGMAGETDFRAVQMKKPAEAGFPNARTLPCRNETAANTLELSEANCTGCVCWCANQYFVSDFIRYNYFNVGNLHFDTPRGYLIWINTKIFLLWMYD
jgi:hypothetical protein